jgi:hypothetical protein
MKPYEYYNFPQRKKRAWWLPLVLVLVLVIGGAIFRSCRSPEEETEPQLPTGSETGLAESNYHTVMIGGELYYILDREYEGAYELQLLRFTPEAASHSAEIPEIAVPDGRIPEAFRQETVLDREAYLAFCETWGLTPAFPDHTGSFAILACASENSSRVEVQVADAVAEGNTLRLLVRERFGGVVPDSLGYVLTVPVPASVTKLETVPVYSEGEAENLRRYGTLNDPNDLPVPEKPVIYLYPETETRVTVKLDCDGGLACTYPAYGDGWTVTAAPDGTLRDDGGQTYSYLYWEGAGSWAYDFSRGFCVAGADTAAFLEEALTALGLTRREANEFIVYWLPRMEGNPWNLIAFQGAAYTDRARLEVSPAPDTVIRVFMAWRPLEEAVALEPQDLTAPARAGFTVVEWGGAEAAP